MSEAESSLGKIGVTPEEKQVALRCYRCGGTENLVKTNVDTGFALCEKCMTIFATGSDENDKANHGHPPRVIDRAPGRSRPDLR